MTSACSTVPGSSDTTEAQDQPEQKFEQQTGSIDAVDTTPQAAPAPTNNIQIKADYPRQYVVVKGDTLWDIANKFLRDPWFWPEIWHRNPQVKNPHLIYPGDILTLIYVNGMPQIQLTRGEDTIRSEMVQQGQKTVKLSPNIHRQSLDAAIPTIPNDAIRQFLTRPRVVSQEEWEQAPYIVGSDDAHLIMGAANKIYVRGELDKERIRYSVFRKGDELVDPVSGETLGYEIIYAGQARINSYDMPSAGELVSTKREVLIGDRLLPTDKSSIDQLYYPRLPETDMDGQIISLFDAIAGIAKHQIAVINKGKQDGLEVGHLLGTYQKGELARDKFLSSKKIKRGEENKLMVQLPDERSGLMMIFKTFDKVSYGLILESTRPIKKFDMVRKPR